MFMSNVNKKEEIRNIVIQDLRTFGIKYRQKKQKQNVQEIKDRKIFKRPLKNLSTETVTMPNGQQLIVPKLVHELCSFIFNKVDTEGLFRKGGSKARQNEIKLYIDAGCHLNDEHHQIDVASVLKTFFRELPEPLLPYSFHEIFLRCMLLKEKQLEAILLCCLLLPSEHLNTLTYFMQFLNQVTEYSKFNKMDSYNLSVVIGPTLLPADEKLAPSATKRLSKTCELFKLLIDNAYNIGVLPNNIIDRIEIKLTSDLVNEDVLSVKKKKKRRSGSLTRMFNGLKKIVTSKSNDEALTLPSVTPDLLLTPCLNQSGKKRKLESGFSNKKRKDLIHTLPHGSVLSTPYDLSRTPISVDPNPKKSQSPLPRQQSHSCKETGDIKEKWYSKNKTKKNDNEASSNVTIKKRWSAVGNVTTFKKTKKRNSCAASLNPTVKASSSMSRIDDRKEIPANVVKGNSTSVSDADYVRISKTEYEEIKNRVLAIERRLSLELDNVDVVENPIEKVQDAYEKTLNQAEPLSPTTDHLARRLSRELKIRKTSETRVIRSPSARKIGSLRRRSRELEHQHTSVARRQSWHVANLEIIPKINLKRGRPNTVQSGLKTPVKDSQDSQLMSKETPGQKIKNLRSSSFSGTSNKSPVPNTKALINSVTSNTSENWINGESFFNKLQTGTGNNLENCRASIVRLRNQNAGMVLAKAKLFDGLLDSDSNTNSFDSQKSLPKAKPGNKIGNTRNLERQNARIRTLKADERKLGRKSLSPRKKTIPRHRMQIVKIPFESNLDEMINSKENCSNYPNKPLCNDTKNIIVPDLLKSPICCNSPQNVPYIKKTLSVKSPKRLYRTPIKVDYKRTPIKVSSKQISDC